MKNYSNWEEVFSVAQPMEFSAFNTGHITGKVKTYSEPSSFPADVDIDIDLACDMMAFAFRHPKQGDVLIDCGFSKAFTDNPPYGYLSVIMMAFQKLNDIRYSQGPGEDFEHHVERLHLDPSHVFLTHFHPDHTSGIPALDSGCTVHFGKKEESVYYRMLGGGHLKGKKIELLDFDTHGFALYPFEKVLDVFGDGSLMAISTPGHTKDHIAYLVNTAPVPQLIVGDAELNRWAVSKGVKVNTDYGKRGQEDVNRSSDMIQRFLAAYPAVEVQYSHEGQGQTETGPV